MVDALSIDGSGGSVGRAVAHYSDSNVSVHPRRTLCAVGVQRLVGFYFSSAVLGFAFPNRIRGVRDLCFSVVEGPSCARWLIIF